MDQPTIFDFRREALNACSNIAEESSAAIQNRIDFLTEIKNEIDVLLDDLENASDG